jgi:hypothetical protein
VLPLTRRDQAEPGSEVCRRDLLRPLRAPDHRLRQRCKAANWPRAERICSASSELKREGKIVERTGDTPVGFRREYVWLKEPDLTPFLADEIDVLNEVMDWICDSESAKSVSDKSHDGLWDETEIGASMPVRAGAVVPAEITLEAVEWAKNAFA